MKIALIYLGRRGGAVPYSFEMAKALLLENTAIFAVLSTNISNKNEWENLALNNTNLTIRFVPTYNSKIEFVKNLFLTSNKYKEIEREIDAYNPDAIYLPMISLYVIKFKGLINKYPLITTIHDYSQHPGMRNPITNWIFRHIEKESDKFVVLTSSYVPMLMKRFNLPESKIAHIPHANFSYYNPQKLNPDFSIKYNNILFFGRITKYKGLIYLLKAAESIFSQNDLITLTIVGNGDITPEEMRIIQNYPSRIKLINKWVDDSDVWEYFSKTDLTVLPYIEASQSGVVAISFSCGKTVVATDTGGLREQVIPGGGVIVPPKDITALSNAILDIYTKNEIEDKNIQAFNYSQTHLSWSKSAKKLLSLIST